MQGTKGGRMDYIENRRFSVLVAYQYLSMLLDSCKLICDIVPVWVIIVISSLALRLLNIETELREEKQNGNQASAIGGPSGSQAH